MATRINVRSRLTLAVLATMLVVAFLGRPRPAVAATGDVQSGFTDPFDDCVTQTISQSFPPGTNPNLISPDIYYMVQAQCDTVTLTNTDPSILGTIAGFLRKIF